MKRAILIVALIALSAFTGCASQADFLNSRQEIAMQTAVNRARFDMNCPAANGQVLSREVTQPAIQGPMMMGEERGVFTIGVEGAVSAGRTKLCARWAATVARRSKGEDRKPFESG